MTTELSTAREVYLYWKWGCDGSSGQSLYKQTFTAEGMSDSSIFMVSIVPLQLCGSEVENPCWSNPHPSSTRLCRPIKFEFAKETPCKIMAEVNKIQLQINQLKPTYFATDTCQIMVHHKVQLTMIDGKVRQVITETPSSASCCICGCKPSQMNDIENVVNRTSNESALKYGMSTLHAWIRFMECILHIAYRLQFKKWSASNPDDKKLLANRKEAIQKQLRQELGITVDVPRQGAGTSNDGNTARRFFRNWEQVSVITEVNKDLLYRLYVILQVITSGFQVDAEAFEDYSYQTARVFVQCYAWFYMPSTLHMILIHGKSLIESTIMPIGWMSEEAQEARNKDFKRFRLHNSRKCSRTSTNEDIIHNLLISSDPLISGLRPQWTNVPLDLTREAKELLISSSQNSESDIDLEENGCTEMDNDDCDMDIE